MTKGQRQGVYFPIRGDRADFNKDLQRKLPGVRRGDVAVVRRSQPYRHARPRRDRHFLSILSELNNGDKHRTLQPVWVFPTRLDIEVWRMQDCVVSKTGWPRRLGPLYEEREIAFIRARKRGDNPHLEVGTTIAAEPSIRLRLGVKSWTITCAGYMSVLLRQFSEPPEDVQDMELREWFGAPAQEDVEATKARA